MYRAPGDRVALQNRRWPRKSGLSRLPASQRPPRAESTQDTITAIEGHLNTHPTRSRSLRAVKFSSHTSRLTVMAT